MSCRNIAKIVIFILLFALMLLCIIFAAKFICYDKRLSTALPDGKVAEKPRVNLTDSTIITDYDDNDAEDNNDDLNYDKYQPEGDVIENNNLFKSYKDENISSDEYIESNNDFNTTPVGFDVAFNKRQKKNILLPNYVDSVEYIEINECRYSLNIQALLILVITIIMCYFALLYAIIFIVINRFCKPNETPIVYNTLYNEEIELHSYSGIEIPVYLPSDFQLQTALPEELPEELPGGMRTKLPAELLVELQADLPAKMQLELSVELPAELQPEMLPKLALDIPAEMTAEITDELPVELQTESPTELSSELPGELQPELLPKLSLDLPAEIPAEIPEELPTELQTESSDELSTELPSEVPAELPVELRNGLTAEIAATLQVVIPIELLEKL